MSPASFTCEGNTRERATFRRLRACDVESERALTFTANQHASETGRAFESAVAGQKLRTRLWPILRSPWTQVAVLIAGTLLVYRYAFLDVARADQLIYLYRTVDIHGLWNLTLGLYDFNRTHSVGDFVLFRPILYMLLGLERWLWGYNFLAWQATSIGLHILVVLSLFSYFHYICRRFSQQNETSFAPFISTLFFAFLYAGTELVAWHHIVGYLLFCLLAVQALFAYQRFLDRHNGLDAASIVLFAGLACFTYEIGSVLAFALGVSLLATVVVERSTKQAAPTGAANHAISIAAAALLLTLPAVYLTWSYWNYIATVGAMTYRPPVSNLHLILLSVKSIVIWTISIFAPGSLRLYPGGRIAGGAAHTPLLTAGIAAIAVACAIIVLVRRRVRIDIVHDGLPALAMGLITLSFAFIISAGREAAGGGVYVLGNNTYYTYIFAQFLLVGLFHIVVAPAVAEGTPVIIRTRRLLFASIGVLAVIAGAQTYRLHEAMYQTYSGPIGRLVQKIEALKAQHGGEADFSFSLDPACGGIYLIPWFADQALEKHQRYTIATALFPHEARDAGGKYTVQCP
jgi:hypothetical protein